MATAEKNTDIKRIALVAGEVSGDLIGAGLIAHLKSHYPNATFEGIGGKGMVAAGLESIVPMERLSVMGLVEVLGRLRELLALRRSLIKRWQQSPPDVFIGIDAPDFNLGLEQALKHHGIPTVHYVSPSVWMWRQKRVFKIAKSVDLMLTLFPFEADFYREHHVPVTFVGHHLADKIPLNTDVQQARNTLGVRSPTCVCLMPGSRQSEVARMAPLFFKVAEQFQTNYEHPITWLVPAANRERLEQITYLLKEHPELNVKLLDGQSHDAMSAADAVLLASGTATLEALLLKKPMIVSYKLSPLTFYIMKRMAKRPYVSLPNLLADAPLVPELLQTDATLSNLCQALEEALDHDSEVYQTQQKTFNDIHHTLRQNADEKAAQAVIRLLEHRAQ